MALVEIPLNSFTYRFRRLTWQEEFQISFTADEDQRKTFLAHTLADVSGLPITSVKDARRVLDSIPVAASRSCRQLFPVLGFDLIQVLIHRRIRNWE
jgi:hypothetical protein